MFSIWGSYCHSKLKAEVSRRTPDDESCLLFPGTGGSDGTSASGRSNVLGSQNAQCSFHICKGRVFHLCEGGDGFLGYLFQKSLSRNWSRGSKTHVGPSVSCSEPQGARLCSKTSHNPRRCI